MIDEGMVVAEYNSLSCISGSGAELTISVVDMNGSSAEFKFPVLSALFECFGVLRALAEASRDKSVDLGKCVVDLANPSDTGQFVFSAIEVELGDHNQNTEVAPEIPVTEEAFDPLMKVLRPIKLFYDQINGMHFDIHVKLRILILISFVSTFLKWISFLPFCALAMMAFLLFTAWKSINKDPEEEEDASVCNVPTEAKGFMKTQKIMRDWLFWDDPRKGMILMYSVGAVFVGWLILPARVYRWACFLVWLGVMGRLIMKSEMGAMIFQGDCFLG
jgi:hypothetical protein